VLLVCYGSRELYLATCGRIAAEQGFRHGLLI